MSLNPIDRDIETGGGGGTPPVIILTQGLPNGNVGSVYFEYLDATDGVEPYLWTRTSGSLPTGLILNSSGSISGTPTTVGIFTFTIRARDQIGGLDFRQLSITIQTNSAPVITTTSLPPVLVGQVYNQTIQAINGTPPYLNWQIVESVLPTGISLNALTGVISGTPTVVGTYSFTIQVTDTNSLTDIQALTILVRAISPTITTTSIPESVAGAAYSATILATGGTTPYTNWSIQSGSLPQGLNLVSSPTMGTIIGTPTQSGNFNFVVRVTDSSNAFASQSFTLTVYDGTYPIISTLECPNGQIGSPYNKQLIVIGGSLPYTWTIRSGSLPAGLALSPSGTISGSPTTNGSYIFTVKATDNNLNFDTQILSIVIGAYTLPSIVTPSFPNALRGVAYSSYVQGIGGNLAYNWSVLNPLPTGLILNSVTGLISGTPTVAGTYTFRILLADRLGQIDIETFTIIVGLPTLPIIITTFISAADRSINYSQTLSTLGGTPSYTYTLSQGLLPTGLTLSTTGIISGVTNLIGLYNFTVTVTDSAFQTDTQNYSLIIRSSGYNSRCCICVFTGDIIQFSHNSINGLLTATGGTILSDKSWQAPSVAGFYDVTISAETVNGIITVKNTVNVIEKLKLVEDNDFLNSLLPGDSFYLKTNYPPSMVTWKTLDSEIPVVTPNGHVYINSNPADKCFGALNCTVRGTLRDIENCSITSMIDVKIEVNPVYPTPDNCGPDIGKWKRETRDFRVITTEFEGGCDETHIRNKSPIIKWNITYAALPNYTDSKSVCPNCLNATGDFTCDHIKQNHKGDDCNPILRSSNRLDDFWNLVYGEYKTFTLIDYDTQEIWNHVRFADSMSSDHTHRRNSASRSVNLVWKPCCSSSVIGGICSKHGMLNYKPSYRNTLKPISCELVDRIVASITNISFNSISLNWSVVSNNPIAGYQIKLTGDIYNQFIIDVGNINKYVYRFLKSNTLYLFEVRAYNNNKYSSWSAPVGATTLMDLNDEGCLIDTYGEIIIDADGDCFIDGDDGRIIEECLVDENNDLLVDQNEDCLIDMQEYLLDVNSEIIVDADGNYLTDASI